MKYKLLSDGQIAAQLAALPDWTHDDKGLSARFEFKGFMEAIAFMNSVAVQAEKMQHHPNWSNAWNVVECHFVTHDADNRVTDLDLAMATRASDIYARYR